MQKQVNKYEYLWDGTEPQWALVRLGVRDGLQRHLIVNIESKSAQLIEDDAVAQQVIQKMLNAGVPIMTPEQMRQPA